MKIGKHRERVRRGRGKEEFIIEGLVGMTKRVAFVKAAQIQLPEFRMLRMCRIRRIVASFSETWALHKYL